MKAEVIMAVLAVVPTIQRVVLEVITIMLERGNC